MPYCWCNPKMEVITNGIIHISHNNPMPNTKPYNKEEVMKEAFDLKCINGAMYFGTVKEPCKDMCCPNEQNYEEAEKEFTDFLNQALTAAEQAGEERMREKIRALINDGRYIADEIIEEALK